MAKILQKGDNAPDFRLPSSDCVDIALSDLLSKKIILYFYPKDNTPGCTIEAKDFTLLKDEFKKHNFIIVGISPDSPKSHCNFIQKQSLDILLLSDDDKQVASAYGAYGAKKMYGKEVFGIIRSTFLIDTNGALIECFYNVKAKNHAQHVLDFIKKHNL